MPTDTPPTLDAVRKAIRAANAETDRVAAASKLGEYVKLHEDFTNDLSERSTAADDLSAALRKLTGVVVGDQPRTTPRQPKGRPDDPPTADLAEVLKVLKRLQPANAAQVANELGDPTRAVELALSALYHDGKVQPHGQGRYRDFTVK